MRRGSLSAGVKPWTAQPLDDDLLRPWRFPWDMAIWMHLRTRRAMGVRVVGDRNMLRRVCRYARWGRSFYYFNGTARRMIPPMRHVARVYGSRR